MREVGGGVWPVICATYAAEHTFDVCARGDGSHAFRKRAVQKLLHGKCAKSDDDDEAHISCIVE